MGDKSKPGYPRVVPPHPSIAVVGHSDATQPPHDAWRCTPASWMIAMAMEAYGSPWNPWPWRSSRCWFKTVISHSYCNLMERMRMPTYIYIYIYPRIITTFTIFTITRTGRKFENYRPNICSYNFIPFLCESMKYDVTPKSAEISSVVIMEIPVGSQLQPWLEFAVEALEFSKHPWIWGCDVQ